MQKTEVLASLVNLAINRYYIKSDGIDQYECVLINIH